MKKIFEVFSVVALSLLIIIRCEKFTNKTKLVIRYAGLGDYAELRIINKSIKLYEKENPNVSVQFLHTPGNAYWDKLETMIAGGSDFDIMYMGGSKFIELASKNAFYPLDEFIKKYNVNLNNFYSESVNVFRYKNYLYALPRDVAPYVIFFNKDLFDSKGINIPSDNWTEKEFVQIGKRLTNLNKREYGLVISVWWGYYIPFVMAHNGEIIKDNRLNVNDPIVKDAMKKFISYFTTEKIAATTLEMRDLALFDIGKAGMTMTGYWMIPSYKKLQFKWDVLPMPKFKRRTTNLSYAGYAIYKKSKHPEEAFKFLKFMVSEKIQRLNAELELAVPALKSVAESDWFLNKAPYNRCFVKSMKFAKPVPYTLGWDEIGSIMDRYMEMIVLGKISFEKGLAEMKKEVDNVLAKKQISL